jgi:NADPH2:quinone reductase
MLPATMTAIDICRFGGPEVLAPATVPVPAPGPGEVLIKVAAAGVNRPDAVQREGNYPPPPGASKIPGLEVAGTLAAIGAGVKADLGTPVTALLTGGGYAEYAVAPFAQTLPVPKGFSMVEAAALPETFFTVWSNVFDRAHLKPGETFLVHGGTSGIGTTAIMLASAFGATVLATAGSAEKCEICKKIGAEYTINYREQDFVAAVMAATDGQGVNVILDMVGGDYIDRNLKCLAEEGRLVQIAFLKGPKVSLNFLPVMLKRLTLTGSTLRARDVAFKAATARNLHAKVWPLLESGQIRPVIDQVYPLTQAAEAHRRLESGAPVGKIILTVA